MRDDPGTVSVRDWRAARNGEGHAASRTSESFIVGIGASGGLLAGAAIVFVTLIGIVSFNVWPSAAGISSSGRNVELSAAAPSGGGGGGADGGGPQPGTGEPIGGGENDTPKAPSGRDDDRSHKPLLPGLPVGNGSHGNGNGSQGNGN